MKLQMIANIRSAQGVDSSVSLGYLFAPGAEVTIGREIGNTIAPLIDSLSRHHAKIYEKGGDWFVEDLGSTNGSFLNGAKLEAATKLENGSKLQFGMMTASVELVQDVSAAEPAPAAEAEAPAQPAAPAPAATVPAASHPTISVAKPVIPAAAPVPIAPAKPVEDPKVDDIPDLPPVEDPAAPVKAPAPALKPGLKLPPKPALGAGLKLPPKPALGAGIKLPPRPTLPGGLKLPPKPTLGAGVKLPPKKV